METANNMPFEIHLTVSAKDTLEHLKLACEAASVKLISLELINRKGEVLQDVMTSSKYTGNTSGAIKESKRIAEVLFAFGVNTSRSKIETVPWHPLAPQVVNDIMPAGCYFESHIAINIPKKCESERVAELKKLSLLHNAHYSRNIFKEDFSNIIQMVTIRTFKDREDFNGIVNEFVKEVEVLGFKHDRIISEFALFDTNIQHDDRWLVG